MESLELSEIARFAEVLADKAREKSLGYFRQQLDIAYKSDESPVTVADRETEALIRDMIKEHYPDHAIYGEEHGYSAEEGRYTWVIDPIDGTRNFVSGMPLYGTLIAFLDAGRPVVGIIDIPALDERWTGVKDAPSRFNGKAIKTRARNVPSEAIWYTTSPHYFTGPDQAVFANFEEELPPCRYGIDCYAFGLLASGFVDLVIETQLKPYDYLALVPVIEGAGGKVTDWKGSPLKLDSDGRVIAAANEQVHTQSLSMMP